MTFPIRPIGLFVGVLVAVFAQGALASKQVITCENSIKMVLFGLQSPYGEIFNSGLTNISSDSSTATLTSQSRLNEERLSDALFVGSDYDGNSVEIQIPKSVLGKTESSPFSTLAKLIFEKSKREKTLEIRCVSQVTP